MVLLKIMKHEVFKIKNGENIPFIISVGSDVGALKSPITLPVSGLTIEI